MASHPLLWSDGKYYSVTAEKQALLTSILSLYQLSVRSSSMYNLTWNSTGDECTEWEYEKLAALALAIGQYVKPYVSYQQEIELVIKAAKSVKEVHSIVIDYNKVNSNA